MASLHHATLTAVLTFVVLVSGAGIVPGTGATSVGGQAVTVQSDTVEAMRAVDSYRAVTNMDVSVGANRTFTNVTTAVNRSMETTTVSGTDRNATVHVVGDWRYRNTSDGWLTEATGPTDVAHPAQDQVALLNRTRVVDFRRTRAGGQQIYRLDLLPENRTLAGLVAAQPDNEIDRPASVTVLDRSYGMDVNRTTHRIRRVQMTLKFRHDGEIGRATMVTWFAGYNRTVPSVPDRATAAN